MKVFIVDDEQDSRAILKALISSGFPDIEIAGESDNIKESVAFLNSNAIDLLLLDIQLNEGSGFDVLHALRYTDFEIIFVTAHDEFALQAIKNNALDYLLKPIDRQEFYSAIKKCQKKSRNQSTSQLKELIAELSKKKNPGSIQLPTQSGFKIVEVDTIIHCESESNYTRFYLNDGSKILVSKTMKEYQSILDQYSFVRIHHSHIVNIRFIREYVKGRGGEVIMENGNRLGVSESRKQHLLEVLK